MNGEVYLETFPKVVFRRQWNIFYCLFYISENINCVLLVEKIFDKKHQYEFFITLILNKNIMVSNNRIFEKYEMEIAESTIKTKAFMILYEQID